MLEIEGELREVDPSLTMRKSKGDRRTTVPYIQELFVDTVKEVKDMDIEEDAEGLMVAASVLAAIIEDNSAASISQLAPLTQNEQIAWSHLDFNLSSEFMGKGGRELIQTVVMKAVNAALTPQASRA